MKDEIFKQKLTEVCEWEIPITLEATEQGRENRRRRLEKAGQNCFNPTFPPKIKKLKHQEQACEDCGKIVQGRTKNITIYKNKSITGLKERCMVCDLHKDPYTGQFTLTGTEASIKWNTYCKGAKTRYKPKIKDTESKDKTVVETDTGTITFYHENSVKA